MCRTQTQTSRYMGTCMYTETQAQSPINPHGLYHTYMHTSRSYWPQLRPIQLRSKFWNHPKPPSTMPPCLGTQRHINTYTHSQRESYTLTYKRTFTYSEALLYSLTVCYSSLLYCYHGLMYAVFTFSKPPRWIIHFICSG